MCMCVIKRNYQSDQVWINKQKLPYVAYMFLTADLSFSMFVKQSFLFSHAELALA
jgi:hypothetical protein